MKRVIIDRGSWACGTRLNEYGDRRTNYLLGEDGCRDIFGFVAEQLAGVPDDRALRCFNPLWLSDAAWPDGIIARVGDHLSLTPHARRVIEMNESRDYDRDGREVMAATGLLALGISCSFFGEYPPVDEP